MGSRERGRRRSTLGARMLRRWLTLAAVGAAVGGVLVLSDEEKRRQFVDGAKELRDQLRGKLQDQWQAASPHVEEWARQGRQLLGSVVEQEPPDA